MTRKYLSGSHDRSCLNSVNAKEWCCNAYYSIGYIGPPFIGLKAKMPPTIPCGIKEWLLYRYNAKTVALFFKATYQSAFLQKQTIKMTSSAVT